MPIVETNYPRDPKEKTKGSKKYLKAVPAIGCLLFCLGLAMLFLAEGGMMASESTKFTGGKTGLIDHLITALLYCGIIAILIGVAIILISFGGLILIGLVKSFQKLTGFRRD